MKRFLILTTALLLLSGCSNNWGWYVVDPTTKNGWINLKFMASGAYYTIIMSLTAILISVVVGLLVALPGLSKKRGWRLFNRTYVEIVRAVPILVLILWVYYGLPALSGITLNVFWAGVLALALSDSAFQAEIFRAGIEAIPKGQIEAARTLGLREHHVARFVVIPQAIAIVLPALGNEFIAMLKDTSLLSILSIRDVTQRMKEFQAQSFLAFEPFNTAALLYVFLTLLAASGIKSLDNIVNKNRIAEK